MNGIKERLLAASRIVTDAFRLDWRSILLFRVLLGGFLLFDMIEAFRCADVFYTNAGVLPRLYWSEIYKDSTVLSLHAMSDHLYFVRLLIVVQMVFAVMLMVSYRPRLASIVSWALFASLANRNWFCADGANEIGLFLLFASIYLPEKPPRAIARRKEILSAGTVLILLQLVVMYMCAGWAKHESPEWQNGTALDLTMRWDEYAKPLTANFLLKFPWLLKYASYAVVWLEWFGVALFFVPWKRNLFRILGIVLFAGLHLGIDATLHIELFCYYPLAGLAALVPSNVWDALSPLGRRVATAWKTGLPRLEGLRTRFVADAQFVPRPTALRACAWYLGLCLAAISFWSAGPAVNPKIPYPKWMSDVNNAVYGYQNWNLFIHPPKSSGWYRGKAQLADGSVVDILQSGAPYTDSRPADPSAIFPNRRWRRFYMQAGAFWSWSGLRGNLARVLMEQWNREHAPEKQIAAFELNYILEGYEPFTPHKDQPDHIVKQWPVWKVGNATASVPAEGDGRLTAR
jgi:hypothetical protein